MSEQTVIERMVTKYINTLNHQPEDCRDATLAMLAAVLELQSILKDHDRLIKGLADLRDIIAEHERRAGGKGE